MNSNCHQCGEKGHLGPPLLAGEFEIALDSVNQYLDRATDEECTIPMLFKHGTEYYCYPCHCLVNYTCFQCAEPVDYLYKDKRCKNNSYVCETCLKRPMANHLAKCYRNDCITPGEVAQEEFEMLAGGEK